MMLALTAIFLATMAFVIGGYVLVNRRTLAAADVARTRLRASDGSERTWSILKDDRISDVPFLNRLLSGKNWIDAIGVQLTRAGSDFKPTIFILLGLMSAISGLLLAKMVGGGVGGIALIIAGLTGPIFWLRWKKKRRLKAFEEQLPDAIDMLVSAMRAGYSFQAATQFIGEEMMAPLGPEFSRFYDEQRLGMDVRSALIGMQGRIDSVDLKMFVTAVLIQRETGGNLGEVLSSLADLVRQRIAMKGQIQTLIAEPKLSARFLAILPVLVFLVLSIMNPHFFDPMLKEDSPGRAVLIGSAISVVIGYMIMMKIADVDV